MGGWIRYRRRADRRRTDAQLLEFHPLTGEVPARIIGGRFAKDEAAFIHGDMDTARAWFLGEQRGDRLGDEGLSPDARCSRRKAGLMPGRVTGDVAAAVSDLAVFYYHFKKSRKFEGR